MAIAAFGWTPGIFWRSTPHEFIAACEGHRAYHDPPKDEGRGKKSPLSADDIEELRDMLARDKA